MKKVLLFGKDGQLGNDLVRVFRADYNLLALNRADLDITNADNLYNSMQTKKPDIVINATAYNKVEAAEVEQELAFLINGQAPGNMAKAAKETGAIFVHVSTDYVFDGSKEFFTEEDPPNPLNAYGASKLAGEELVKSSGAKFYLIRTSSVFGVKEGNQKKNFVDSMIERARAGQRLRVVNDQIMCPTYSYDLAVKIKELIEKPAAYGVYHITNQGSCSWYDFTKKILELMDIGASVEPITTEQSGTKAARPKRSVLKNLALEKIGLPPMPIWEDALKRYLVDKYRI
jgi:dTDP-4-dehydrorhamnose reductase